MYNPQLKYYYYKLLKLIIQLAPAHILLIQLITKYSIFV